MPRQAVRAYQRVGKGGTQHTVRRHARDIPGARKTASGGWFQPVTPARASAGALIGGASYWTFSGAMSLVMLVGFSITAAVGAIMGYDKVKTTVKRRKAAGGKRSVTRLRAKVAVSNAKQKARATTRKAKVFRSKRQQQKIEWRKRIRKMPPGRRFSPVYRARRWWRFRMDEYKTGARRQVNGWIERARTKTGPRIMETTKNRKRGTR